MNPRLQRLCARADGIASVLFLDGQPRWPTLEHAYGGPSVWAPKVPIGTWLCHRGIHTLHSGLRFMTYEIFAPGHSGLLFHWGSLERDSEGCVLVGTSFTVIEGQMAISDTRSAFDHFISAMGGVERFFLDVVA